MSADVIPLRARATAPSLTPLLALTAADSLGASGGIWEAGEMVLPHASDDRVLPTAIFARWHK